MTRTEDRFITRAIKRAAGQLAGAPVELIQRYMLDAIKVAIEDAADEDRGLIGVEVGQAGTAGPAIPQPVMGSGAMRTIREAELQAREYGDNFAQPDADPITLPKAPLMPVEKSEEKSLLILPGQEGFASAAAGKAKVGVDEKLEVWREPTKLLKQGVYERRWQRAVSSLIDIVNSKMPVALQVTPIGASSLLRIDRLNTLSDIPSGMVKVEYGLLGQSGARPSEKNIDGSTLDRMTIDRVVTETFYVKDRTVNWQQRMLDVVTRCEDVFRPRAAHIENRTPARQGSVDLLLSNMKENAGGYGEVKGPANLIDPKSDGGGVLVMNDGTTRSTPRPANSGVVVPNL